LRNYLLIGYPIPAQIRHPRKRETFLAHQNLARARPQRVTILCLAGLVYG
jgi:hypothetical protein